MNSLTLRERLRMFPLHRTFAGTLAFTVAPGCLYFAVENRDSSFIAIALGLGLLALAAVLRPNKLFPFWKGGLDTRALELHQEQVLRATIGSEAMLTVLTNLGLVLSAIGTILNLGDLL